MCDNPTIITQHPFSRRDARAADCRPPAKADEGSVNLCGNHHPAICRLYTPDRHGGTFFKNCTLRPRGNLWSIFFNSECGIRNSELRSRVIRRQAITIIREKNEPNARSVESNAATGSILPGATGAVTM